MADTLVSITPAQPGMYRVRECGDNDGAYTVAELVVLWANYVTDDGHGYAHPITICDLNTKRRKDTTIAGDQFTTKPDAPNGRLQIIR